MNSTMNIKLIYSILNINKREGEYFCIILRQKGLDEELNRVLWQKN